MTVAKEIMDKGPLLDAGGNITAFGWARQPYLDANLENLKFYSLKAFRL